MLNSHTVQYPYAKNDLTMEAVYIAGVLTYLGFAAPGTATSTAGWQICKFTYDGTGNITKRQFASGTNNFDKVMDDYLLGYSYS